MSKNEILGLKSVAYYSGLDGVEIKDIEYGIEVYVLCVSGAWTSNKVPHRVKIYSKDNGELYFKLYGYNIPLDECIRM